MGKFPIKNNFGKKLNIELETTKLTLKQVYSKNISIGKLTVKPVPQVKYFNIVLK